MHLVRDSMHPQQLKEATLHKARRKAMQRSRPHSRSRSSLLTAVAVASVA